jgi:SNF2 family DNA or RNA helicase
VKGNGRPEVRRRCTPVFVYKLNAAGTVEQRMLDLQSRKCEVAAAVYDADTTGGFAFSE